MVSTEPGNGRLSAVPVAERKAKTRAIEVYDAVRERILSGELRPGEKLGPAALAQDYGVSVSVVREALTRLAEQSLVNAQPQQGFQVVPISRADLLELTEVRLDIETLAMRRSVDRGDVAWRSGLVAAHYLLENTETYQPGDPPVLSEDWSRVHAAFHHHLLAACGNARLLEIAQSLRDAGDLYRRWSVPMPGSKGRDIAGEHRAIVEAVQSGDGELAQRRLAAHIAHTTDVLLEDESTQ